MRSAMKRKKLLLIHPGNPWAFYFTPPLALGYIAAATPPGWDIEIIDEGTRHIDYTTTHADLVGIGAMTAQANRAYQIAKIFTARKIPVVMGGIHSSMLPEEAAQYATAVVVGEAEEIWPKVVADCEAGCMQKIYRNEGHMPLDQLPMPRRDLYTGRYPIDVIKTTRGCPFNCDFCCVSAVHGPKYRTRPIASVIEELKQIKRKFIFFCDDNVVGSGRPEDDERAMSLFENMIRSRVNKLWHSQASINVAKNPEMMRLMRKAGCRSLLIGFEALDEEDLKGRGKHHNLKRDGSEAYYTQVIKSLHDHGIAINGFFLNTPFDSQETFRRMSRFLTQSDIDVVTHTILTPLPGARLYERLKNDLCCHDFPRDWERFDFSQLLLEPTHMSKDEFYRLRHEMILQTHSWKRILRLGLQGWRHSKSPVIASLIMLSHVLQKKSYIKELNRNCRELKAPGTTC